jgi:PAS domain S-box-containing protein
MLMDANQLTAKLNNIHQCVARLTQRAQGQPERHRTLLDDTLPELDHILEEIVTVEEALQEHRTILQIVLESIPDAVYMKDLQGRYVFMNSSGARIIGRPLADIIGRDDTMLFSPDSAGRILEHDRLIKLKGGSVTFESTHARDDTLSYYRTTKTVCKDAHGAACGIVGISCDITEHKRAEATLRESEARFRTMADSAPVMIWVSEMDMRCTFFNQPWLEFTGRTQEQELVAGWAEGVHPDDQQRCLDIYSQAQAARQSFRMEYRLRRADGEYRWVLDTAVPRYMPDGSFAGYIGSCIDISERRQAQEALRASEERFRRYFEIGLIGIAIIAPTKACLEVNDEVCAILGYQRCELLRMTWADFTHPDDLAANVDQFNRVLAGEIDGYTLDKRYVRKDGQVIYATVSVKCVRRADRSVDYFIKVLQDITKRKRAEEALQLYAGRLEILHEIDRAILAAHSPVEIAQAALSRLRQLVPCQRGGLTVLGPGYQQAITLLIDSNGDFQVDSDVQLPPDLFGADTGSRDAGFAPEPLISPAPSALVQALFADDLRSYMVLPLISHGTLIGALSLGASSEDTFTPAHLDVAREVADSVAIAIQQARLYEQVIAGRERQRSLTRRLIEAQETERRQFAQELHDQIGQTLTALNISLRIIGDQLSPESAARVGPRLADSARLTEETMAQIRDVMAALRPAVLDDYGLGAALRWYVDHFSEHTGLNVMLDLDMSDELRLAPQVETALFRVTQEALTNVAKHARVAQATVALAADKQMIRLIIADHGVGFDTTEPSQAGERYSLGLIGMHERVEAVGGHLRLESIPGQGTHVVAEVRR